MKLGAVLIAFALVGCIGGTLVRAPMDDGTGGTRVAVGDAGTFIGTADTELLVGKWAGQGVQTGGKRWEITLDIAAADGALTVRVTYPALGCGGEWRLAASGSQEWSGEETIGYGTTICTPHGLVKLRLAGESLEFDWRESNAGQTLTAKGSLRRTRK
ncbi:hypothetical protein BH09MYX1_BH09MYX1_43450 [soil metagenome]